MNFSIKSLLLISLTVNVLFCTLASGSPEKPLRSDPLVEIISKVPLIAFSNGVNVRQLAPTAAPLISGLTGDLCFSDENCSKQGANRTCVDSEAVVFSGEFIRCPGSGDFCFCFAETLCKSNDDCPIGESCVTADGLALCAADFYASFLKSPMTMGTDEPSFTETPMSSSEPGETDEFIIG